MPPDDRERLVHMLEASREAMSFVSLRRREDLDTDRMLLLALTRLVEIVGEAAKNVSSDMRLLAPELPWKAICGARDRLAHGYHAVDEDILWRIVTRDLPALIPQLENLLRRTDPPRSVS